MRNPTGWNGTGQPDVIDVDYAYWRLPDEGKPAVCSTWNGKEWVAGKTEWPGTVATPVTLDPMEIQVREWGRSWCVPQCVCHKSGTVGYSTTAGQLTQHWHPALPPQAYVDSLCANLSSAEATLTAAIKSGGPAANLAAMSTLYKCAGDVRLDRLFNRVVWPIHCVDSQRSLE